MKKVRLSIISFIAVLGFIFVLPQVAYADPAGQIDDGIEAIGGGGGPTLGERIRDVVNVLLFVLGAIAVIMIIIGGIRYATSNGESSAITGAKNTILYAVVGLVVAVLAYAIVNFVIAQFT